jgi:3-deoxy-D-manno-octulosonic-acid transferase
VLLGDSLGELFAYYAACDVAFVGGSLAPLGGQNLIEAASVGRPVLVGPHTFNFAQAAVDAVAAGAALRVEDASELMQSALNLLRDEPRRTAMGDAARAFAQAHRGATQRTMDAIETQLALPDHHPIMEGE